MILVASSDNCGCFSLILHQNSLSGDFLKVSCNMVSENISMNFSYSSTLKSICLSHTLNRSVVHHDFVTLCIGHWKILVPEFGRSYKC